VYREIFAQPTHFEQRGLGIALGERKR